MTLLFSSTYRDFIQFFDISVVSVLKPNLLNFLTYVNFASAYAAELPSSQPVLLVYSMLSVRGLVIDSLRQPFHLL